MATVAVTSSGPLVCSAAQQRLDRHRHSAMLMSTSSRVALVGSQGMGLLRRLRVPELGRSGCCSAQPTRQQSAAVRAVWKQEMLWAEAPVADVGLACEEHYHFVLDISGNRELMEGHTKAGQFVQVKA